MAAASSLTLYFNNGKSLNVYCASTAAVGTSPTVSWDGAAVATGPTDFVAPANMVLTDQINLVATAGQAELYNVTRSVRTGRFIEMLATSHAVTVPNRPIPQIGLTAGNTYRFIQTVAQTAA